ncbi:hypothetical protein [uncultured Agrobacterium sp.]|uniref:hypothetical protein n=1 Tax=uncultured Agrobacterium sp. TaxID=157277 RepID=UPI0025CBC062|nr:hypothetical protein [uncultured Agrobacterium sp.]
MNDNYVAASLALANMEKERGRLERDNSQLITGTAKQAATIRTLQQRNSDLEAEVTLEKYNVEFLKMQGRKTRVINREKLRGFKGKVGNLNARLIAAEAELKRVKAANHVLREQMSVTIEAGMKMTVQLDKVTQALNRMIEDKPLPFQFVIEERPKVIHYTAPGMGVHKMDELRVCTGALKLRMTPEHHRSEDITFETARQASKELGHFIEREILKTLLGEEVTPQNLMKRRVERMRQQQQNFRPDF